MQEQPQERCITELISVDNPRAIPRAVDIIRRGGLVVFPTDTVYGVGCALHDEAALRRLYAAKERPLHMAIPVLISDPVQISQVARHVPGEFALLAERFWPGGLSIIVPRRPELPDVLTAGGDTVAVRLPDHPVARALITAAGGALAVTSANRSGRPAPRTAAEAQADLQGRVELILDGGMCREGVASSIVDLSVSPPRLVRRGPLELERLREVLPNLEE